MHRLGNPLDGRQALPTHLVAQGGADCTSTTCSSSCVVTAITATVMSARLVGKVEQATLAAPAVTGTDTPSPASTPPAPVGIGIRLLAGLVPLLMLLATVAGFAHTSAFEPVLAYAGLMWAISRRLADPGQFIRRHVLLMAGMAALGALEFGAWLYLIKG